MDLIKEYGLKVDERIQQSKKEAIQFIISWVIMSVWSWAWALGPDFIPTDRKRGPLTLRVTHGRGSSRKSLEVAKIRLHGPSDRRPEQIPKKAWRDPGRSHWLKFPDYFFNGLC